MENRIKTIIHKYFRPLAAGVAKAFFTDSLVAYEDIESDALLGCWQAINHFKSEQKKMHADVLTGTRNIWRSRVRAAVNGMLTASC